VEPWFPTFRTIRTIFDASFGGALGNTPKGPGRSQAENTTVVNKRIPARHVSSSIAMLRRGKHHGSTFEQAAEDRGYCAWVLRATADGKRLPQDLRSFSNYIKDKHGGILYVGKHKNRFFDEVLRDDPAYVTWAAKLQNPSSCMQGFSSYAQELEGTWPPRGHQPATKPNPRDKDTLKVIPKCPPVQKAIRKRPPRQKTILQPFQHNTKTTPSVLDMLCQRNSGRVAEPQQASEPKEPIEEVNRYIEKLKRAISEGRMVLRGDPWIVPSDPFQEAVAINAQRQHDGERQIDATDALNLVMRLKLFVWAPEIIFPGRRLRCLTCGSTTSFDGWKGPRVLHSISGLFVYIASKHKCRRCSAISGCKSQRRAKNRTAKKATSDKRPKTTFMADAKEALAQLPAYEARLWDFVNTGRTICDASVANLVRAMATRNSWKAISDTIQELKETLWTKTIVLLYLQLCDLLQITPTAICTTLPPEYNLRHEWIRDFFVADARERRAEVDQELTAETGDDVLVFDWTRDAAKRCGGNFLFNAMSGAGTVLTSTITDTSGPSEVQPLVRELKRRGVCPKVVYVDNGCCGAWKTYLIKLWPGVHVRLDGMHAIRRLTQTTTSTQHPWHGRFCAALSEAIYTYDQQETRRLTEARNRDGLASLPDDLRSKYIPRVVTDPCRIVAAMDRVLQTYQGRAHPEMGELLSPGTTNAWAILKEHVNAGCLCDPPNISLNALGEPVVIGGDEFRPILRTMRGASPLEGFHTHQKQWLGPFAHHSAEAGTALLADGALRWNRRRRNDAAQGIFITPPVFTGGLLQGADHLHQHLTGKKLYPGLARSAASSSSTAAAVVPGTGQ